MTLQCSTKTTGIKHLCIYIIIRISHYFLMIHYHNYTRRNIITTLTSVIIREKKKTSKTWFECCLKRLDWSGKMIASVPVLCSAWRTVCTEVASNDMTHTHTHVNQKKVIMIIIMLLFSLVSLHCRYYYMAVTFFLWMNRKKKK